MKIAIIGSGISGLTCGYYLHQDHDITIFEANDYIGGHTATVDVNINNKDFAVDTGFIVYNDRTYPSFIKMMNEIGVTGTATQMSFSVSNQSNGLEYNGHTLSTLFAQKRNLLNPKFYLFIYEILRFNKLAKASANQPSLENLTLGEFLRKHHFSDYFCENYILPMGAAIWSSTLADMRGFPLSFFLNFFLNHGLLDIADRPQWYVIDGGSKAYIEPLTQGFKEKIRLNCPVSGVERRPDGVFIDSPKGVEHFDAVVFACHSDQALRILKDVSSKESDVLSKMAYQANEVTLHTDDKLLPKSRAAWASWNYLLSGKQGEMEALPALTYNMNILQHIECEETFCVSLNSNHKIDPAKILKTFTYHHPVFTKESHRAQKEKTDIDGTHSTWYCGAYWYNGFHEDGVRSALDVVESIQVQNSILEKGVA